MKVAIIHEWFKIYAGSEKVVKYLLELFPEADVYALVEFLSGEDRIDILKNKKVTTTFIQKLPTAKKNHQKFLQLFPYAIEQLNLSEYDLVISSSHAVAKGVLTHSGQTHICYCHSPMRYAWDLYFEYLSENGLTSGLKSIYARYVLHKMRLWDFSNSQRVDYFIANSNYISERIKKVYRRRSDVIYPPVDISHFQYKKDKDDYFLTASRLVSYKKTDIIVEAFNQLPNKELIIIGDGEQRKKLERIANSNIKFVGKVSDEEMKDYLQRARAFIFAAKEDFGILPVEAMACGTPVIAYGVGGVIETVVNKKTGLFFYDQTESSIISAIEEFEGIEFDATVIRKQAENFSIEIFKEKMKEFIQNTLKL